MMKQSNIKERPIIFNAAMVHSILEGRKSQTRRVIKPQPSEHWKPYCFCEVDKMVDGVITDIPIGWGVSNEWGDEAYKFPYGEKGDELWVRETCRAEELEDGLDGVRYLADDFFKSIENSQEAMEDWFHLYGYAGKRGAKVPSIHMPRWASRIQLKIKNVRVERLQDISEADAKAEGLKYHNLYKEWGGVEPHPASRPDCPQWRWYTRPKDAFQYLWQFINGEDSWDSNPWVWVVDFSMISGRL